MNTNRISFLNTYVDNLTAFEAKELLDQMIRERETKYVVTPNSDIVVKMQRDPELKRICDNADLILTDGQIVVRLSEFLGRPIKERVCMTDFVWEVLALAAERGYRVYFFGGKREVLLKATGRIREKYPSLQLAGAYSPPYGFEEDEELLGRINERIRNSRADILLVFLGCPKQEKFICGNKDKYRVPVSITMGGCIDFIAGEVKRAPGWMQRAGFEWFYRFLQEPRRMFRRYFLEDTRIFGLALAEKLKKPGFGGRSGS